MLLSNANIDHSQRVSAIAPSVPNGNEFSDQATNDKSLHVTYNQLVSVVKHCEKLQNEFVSNALIALSAEIKKLNLHARFNKNEKPSVSALKRMPCYKRGRFGHWKSQHAKNETRTPRMSCFNSANEFVLSLISSSDPKYVKYEVNKDNDDRETMSFNMAKLMKTFAACEETGNSWTQTLSKIYNLFDYFK